MKTKRTKIGKGLIGIAQHGNWTIPKKVKTILEKYRSEFEIPYRTFGNGGVWADRRNFVVLSEDENILRQIKREVEKEKTLYKVEIGEVYSFLSTLRDPYGNHVGDVTKYEIAGN